MKQIISKSTWNEIGIKMNWFEKNAFVKNDTFYYFINLDERGAFYADVRDSSENTIYEIKIDYSDSSNENSDESIFTDGYMKNTKDIDGLQEYLISLGVIPPESTVAMGQ